MHVLQIYFRIGALGSRGTHPSSRISTKSCVFRNYWCSGDTSLEIYSMLRLWTVSCSLCNENAGDIMIRSIVKPFRTTGGIQCVETDRVGETCPKKLDIIANPQLRIRPGATGYSKHHTSSIYDMATSVGTRGSSWPRADSETIIFCTDVDENVAAASWHISRSLLSLLSPLHNLPTFSIGRRSNTLSSWLHNYTHSPS
jgi:hypothetical protein